MSGFTQTLEVSPLPDGINWVLLKSFGYDIGAEGSSNRVEVERGFTTDFASIPRFFWIVLPKWGKYGNAAVVHDYLYWSQNRTRAEADKIMLEAMGVLDVPAWQKWPIYYAVHLFGWIAWKRNAWDKMQGFNRVIDLDHVTLKADYEHGRPGLMKQAYNHIWEPVKHIPSIRQHIVAQNPELSDTILALVALKVRHGDIIDAITPIFAKIGPDLNIESKIEGSRIGGEGGGETLLEREGYLITGIDIYRGHYFGRDEIIHVQVSWQKLTRQGLDPATQIVSEKLGSGNYAQISDPPQKFQAKPGHYISDLDTFTSDHTSGETFLHKIDIRQEKLPGIG